jgi:hypothetical protein
VTGATVVRIWRTEIDLARADDYDAFARTKSLPMFRAQGGFVGVLFAGRGVERAVITLWEDLDSAEALSGSVTYKAAVDEIGATGFLRGGQSVEFLSLDGFFGTR